MKYFGFIILTRSVIGFYFADPQYSDVEMFEKGNFKRRKRMRRPHHPYKSSSFRSWNPAAAAAAAMSSCMASADPHLMIRGAYHHPHFGYNAPTAGTTAG